MILKSITLKHFGPFIDDATLHLDEQVTVLTGPNDTGKSYALRAIEILCTQDTALASEVNRYRNGEFAGKWNEDPEVACVGVFTASDLSISKSILPKGSKAGAGVTVRRQMTSPSGQIIEINSGSNRSNPQSQFTSPIGVLRLPLTTEIRQEIDFGKMTEAEKRFVRLGFGAAFSLEKHKGLDPVDRSFVINEAQERLNGMLRNILPKTMPLSFKLFEVAAKPELLAVGLMDEHHGYAPLGSRGAGVRRLLNVMGSLLQLLPDSNHYIVLYDEPEISLHADAQHMLRRLLESLACHPNVQVVYSTHSPAMVNPLRPQSIRVLERKKVKDKAASLFVNSAFAGNFSLVRTSLGMSPADSLLYAPITIVAEGVTEVLCLPLVLKKLSESGTIAADELGVLLSQSHILDGEGDKFEYMCRLAKSQNAKVILFVDGDKQVEVQKASNKHDDVIVIELPSGMEFEEIVPKANFIQAAATLLEDDSGKICESEFIEWEKKANLRPSIMFSKRVERWLRDVFDKPLYKPQVMRAAIELTDTSEIDAAPFKQLFEAMKKVGSAI